MNSHNEANLSWAWRILVAFYSTRLPFLFICEQNVNNKDHEHLHTKPKTVTSKEIKILTYKIIQKFS